MKIIVQKFGGTSVSTKERRQLLIEKVKKHIELGYHVVVVVSAMGRKGDNYATDTLLSLVNDAFKDNNKLATDLLMSCGEIISSVVVSNDLYENGIEAVPLTGGQAGIITDSNFTEATVLKTNPTKIMELLLKGKTPVITGFQGISEDGFITTLGRGGSDTSACIIGDALNADEIQIYTDVDGIMTADPRVVNDASLINEISYNEVFQLADQGAKVIHPKAVEIARKSNIPLLIKNTMSDCIGTVISNNASTDKILVGITHSNDRIQIKIKLSDNTNKVAYRGVLDKLAKNKISLDLINIFPDHQIFTINSNEKILAESILNEAGVKYSSIENCSTIALVGAGMTGVPGIMAKIINILNSNGIEVLQTTDSKLTIWCLIYNENLNKAINLLHSEFNLNNIK